MFQCKGIKRGATEGTQGRKKLKKKLGNWERGRLRTGGKKKEGQNEQKKEEPIEGGQRRGQRKTQEKNPYLLGLELHHHRPSSLSSNNSTSNNLGKEDQGRCRKTEIEGKQLSHLSAGWPRTNNIGGHRGWTTRGEDRGQTDANKREQKRRTEGTRRRKPEQT